MDQDPLVSEQIDAGARFLSEFAKYVPVRAAFWLKESEGRAWYLYVMSDQITDENFDLGYGEVVRIAHTMRDPWFDMMQVKLIGEDDPLGKDVENVRRRLPGRGRVGLHGDTCGGQAVEEVYIYPSPIPAPVS
jgi:hypothetical protein